MNSNKESGAASSSANAAPSVLSVPASVAKHTPTPWDASSSLYVISRLGRVVARCDGMGIAKLDVPHEQMFANAARIVAAVNYCEGLTNEQLADGRESYVGMAFDFERMRASNAELAAALRELMDDVRAGNIEADAHRGAGWTAAERNEAMNRHGEAWNRARAALAKLVTP